MRGQSPPSGASRLRAARCSRVRACFSPWERCTTERRKHEAVGKVVQRAFRTAVLFWPEEEPCIPCLKAGAFWPMFCNRLQSLARWLTLRSFRSCHAVFRVHRGSASISALIHPTFRSCDLAIFWISCTEARQGRPPPSSHCGLTRRGPQIPPRLSLRLTANLTS